MGAGFGLLRNVNSPFKVISTLSVEKRYSFVYSLLVFAQQTVLSSFENTSGLTKELPDSHWADDSFLYHRFPYLGIQAVIFNYFKMNCRISSLSENFIPWSLFYFFLIQKSKELWFFLFDYWCFTSLLLKLRKLFLKRIYIQLPFIFWLSGVNALPGCSALSSRLFLHSGWWNTVSSFQFAWKLPAVWCWRRKTPGIQNRWHTSPAVLSALFHFSCFINHRSNVLVTVPFPTSPNTVALSYAHQFPLF